MNLVTLKPFLTRWAIVSFVEGLVSYVICSQAPMSKNSQQLFALILTPSRNFKKTYDFTTNNTRPKYRTSSIGWLFPYKTTSNILGYFCLKILLNPFQHESNWNVLFSFTVWRLEEYSYSFRYCPSQKCAKDQAPLIWKLHFCGFGTIIRNLFTLGKNSQF